MRREGEKENSHRLLEQRNLCRPHVMGFKSSPDHPNPTPTATELNAKSFLRDRKGFLNISSSNLSILLS